MSTESTKSSQSEEPIKVKPTTYNMKCPSCSKEYKVMYNKNCYCVWCNLSNKGMIELVEVTDVKE